MDIRLIEKSNYKIWINKNPVDYYVYALYDVESERIFYIGKGSKGRQYNHKKLDGSNIFKDNYIETINNNYVEIVLKDCLSECEALEYEAKLINENYKSLTNIVNPKGSKSKYCFKTDIEFLNYLKKVNGYVIDCDTKMQELETTEITMEELELKHLLCKNGLEIFRGFYHTKIGFINIEETMYLFPNIWGNQD